MLVLAPLILIILLLLIREKKRFIYYVPLLLLLADILKIANDGGQAARESILMDYIIIITTLAVCLMIILTNIKVIRGYANGIFILVIYLFGMIMFSTDIWWSFKVYMNVAMPILLFPAAFIITKNIEDIKKAMRPAIMSIVLFLINVAVATYFKAGQEDIQQYGYVQTFIYMGTVNFFSAYGFVYSLIIIPLAYYLTKGLPAKYLLIFLYFAGLFTLILLLKRSYVYLSLAGPLIFIFFISKRKNIRFIGPFLVFGLLAYIMLSDYILASITVRQEVLRRGYAEEGRGIELILYPEVVRNSDQPVSFLVFGEELFNSRGKFTLIERILKDKDRVLHSDIATILFGSGIIGLLLFVRIYYYLVRKFLKIRHKLKQIYHNEMLNVLYAIYLSLIISLIANALSDGILTAINRALPYLMLGAILGVLHKTLYGQPAKHQKNPIP